MDDDLLGGISYFEQFVSIFVVVNEGCVQVRSAGTDGRYSILLKHIFRNSCVLISQVYILCDLIDFWIKLSVFLEVLNLGQFPIKTALADGSILRVYFKVFC